MKRLIIIAILFFAGPAFAQGTPATSHPLNATPTLADQLLGIDDPAGTWEINRFSMPGLIALIEANLTYPAAGIAVSTGSAWGTSKAAPAGTIVGTTDTQTLSNKSFGSGMTWPTLNQDTTGSAATLKSGGTGAAFKIYSSTNCAGETGMSAGDLCFEPSE